MALQSLQQRSACQHQRAFTSRPLVRCAPRTHQQQRASTRGQSVILRASEKAAKLLAEGKRVYEAGDRLAARDIYDKALAEGSALSPEQKHAAMFGVIAVHASFGDVELAQMALRDAVMAGLDYETALVSPDSPQIQSSPQILIQLSRFNKQFRRTLEEKAEDLAVSAVRAKQTQKKLGSSTRVGEDVDLNQLLGGVKKPSPLDGIEGVDTSPAAIAKRVAGVVVAGLVLGVVLFYAGLEYMFPKI